MQDKLKGNLELDWEKTVIKEILFGDFSNKHRDYIKIDNP